MTDLRQARSALQEAIRCDRISPLFAAEIDEWITKLVDRVEVAESLVRALRRDLERLERHEIERASCCWENEQRAERAEDQVRALKKLLAATDGDILIQQRNLANERADAAEAEVDRLRERAAHLSERLRAVERYADALHFAGRLDDERIVRAALESAR